jgi:type IV pilus assembly protein PilY1
MRRCLAGLLAFLIAFGPAANPVYAALTPLADEPLNTTSMKPNIVMTIDDSSSMLFDFLPDWVVTGPYCRGGTGAATASCGIVGAASDFTAVGGGKYYSPGYIFEQYNVPFTGYAPGFDVSGPGAGCFPGAPPTCSPGVNPGPLPGRANYGAGPQPTWPNTNMPYEYWLFWPAPVHNSAVNALYYDPLLTYEPPVDDTGASYPQMNDANTSAWTKVPADPWAPVIQLIDLTAKVNMGLWCNSDWSLGLSTDTTHCRVNGSGAAAFASVPAVDGQDYTYPWAPGDPSQGAFTVATYASGTTTTTYAAQKVTLNANLAGTGVKALWAIAKNEKYFYENENVIWCDPTNPNWPQTGSPTVQTCTGLQAQTCSAFPGQCQNKINGNCSGAPNCQGLTAGTCSGYLPRLCQGSAGVCNNFVAAACNGKMCVGSSAQTCNGTFQTCNSNPQTCSGPFNQVCNLPGTQTCQPPSCSTTYTPPGCEMLPPDPENPCSPVTTCQPPVCTPNPGTCSITGAQCTSNAQCPAQPGACSISKASCMSNANCPNVGLCSIQGQACAVNSDCPIVGGTCSKTGQACTNNAQCPASGNCQIGGAVCLVNSDCPGNCNNPPNAQCMTAATCPAKNGLCSDGVTACQNNGQCPLTGGLCQTRVCAGGANAGLACTKNADCPGSSCKAPAACTVSGTCPETLGKCTAAGGKNGNACRVDNPDCLTNGICSNNNLLSCSSNAQCGKGLCSDNTTQCLVNADCPKVGMCNTNGAACTNDNQCPPTNGVCSITNLPCTVANAATNCPAVGHCSVQTTVQCTTNANCPNIPGPLPPSAATCSTGGVGGVATATLRNDAENNGVVCRRNNKTAGVYTSGRYTYPSGLYLTPISFGSGADACTFTDHWQATPRHYWKVSVEWCAVRNTTVGDKWNQYGESSCQSTRDSSHPYPRFYQYGAAPGTNNITTAAFQRVDLDIAKRNSGITFNHGFDVYGQPVIRTWDEEMTNYANWFAYYRTRITAVKTVTSLTFKELDNTFRVGLHTLSNGAANSLGQVDPSKFVDVQDFTAAQKKKWFDELFRITIPLQFETPNLNAMVRIGEWFRTGSSAVLTGSSDPIVLSCQKNWHMLFTDGFTNQGVPGTLVGNQDDKVPAQLPVRAVGGSINIPGLAEGQPWPAPYREDPNAGASNAASDYAMRYWVVDMRDPTQPNEKDNVFTSLVDPAPWQHLNFAALSLGTQGKLPTANQTQTESQLASGALKWPQPVPTVNKPDASGVDDLWHAAKNGRGRFVNADSADELKLGMGQILQDVLNQSGAHAAAGSQGSSISAAGKHYIYRATYEPGWSGTLTKISVDAATGALGAIVWRGQEQLTAQLQITVANPTPWFTSRRIVTMDDTGKAVPFLWGSLSAAQQDSLAPGKPVRGQRILEFLRGSPEFEGTKLGQLRVRPSGLTGENFLGDIVNAQVQWVGPPSWPYNDGTDPGYSGFVGAYAGRAAMVYAASNEGMLHAFDDNTGDEKWAYIPHDLYRIPTAAGLGALAYQDGALPPFRHHYYVDSSPRVVDVDFAAPAGTDWRTLLVAGMGKGGKSYFALDVTAPGSVVDETTAAAKVLWEFKNADLGYTYGRPFIVKTRAFGGAWVVVVASGYNNATGEGKVFFIRANDGTLLKTMGTGFGSAASPSGLAHIAGYVRDYHNQLVEEIYGGDLYGNFWRFDVSDPDDTKWTVHKLAYLADAAGAAQPVTTPPQIEIDLVTGVDRYVLVGTGRLLDNTDLTDPTISNQQQTLYAIRDGDSVNPLPFTATINPRTDVPPFDPIVNKIKGLATKSSKGWYDDLPAGERITTPIQATISVVAYIGTFPANDPCVPGQPGTLYVRQFDRGNSLLPDGSGGQVASMPVPEGGVGLEIVEFTDNSGGGKRDVRVAITLGTTGNVIYLPIDLPNVLSAHRMSWRLLGQ